MTMHTQQEFYCYGKWNALWERGKLFSTRALSVRFVCNLSYTHIYYYYCVVLYMFVTM